MKTTIVHCKKEKYDVYCGRPSPFGNPFELGKDGTRDEVIEKYRQWIQNKPELLDKLNALVGKRLGCYCHPKRCHCCVLLDLIQEKFGGIRINEFELETKERLIVPGQVDIIDR